MRNNFSTAPFEKILFFFLNPRGNCNKSNQLSTSQVEKAGKKRHTESIPICGN